MIDIDHYHDLLNARTDEEWLNALIAQTRKQGYAEAIIGLKKNSAAPLDSALILSNYNPAWRKKYDSEKYGLIDPMVLNCFSQVLPIIWDERAYKSLQQKQFFEEATGFGYRHGISFPLHGPHGEVGTLSLNLGKASNDPASHAHIVSTLAELIILKDIALSSFLALPQHSAAGDSTPKASRLLSSRAIEILSWCARGKTSWEISRICGCSEANVNFHVNKIRKTLGVSDRKAAVVKAYAMGLISL